MQELKQKISYLQAELTNTHDEYSSRISRLEQEVSNLREENLRIRGDRDHTSQRHDGEVKELKTKLRDMQQQCGDIDTELKLEQSRVAELQAQIKASEIAGQVTRAFEERLHRINEVKTLDLAQEDKRHERLNDYSMAESSRDDRASRDHRDSMNSPVDWNDTPTKEGGDRLTVTSTSVQYYGGKSEDSGFTDPNKSRLSEVDDKEALVKTNEDLLQRISNLQSQLDNLKAQAAGSPSNEADVESNRSRPHRTSIHASFNDKTEKADIQEESKVALSEGEADVEPHRFTGHRPSIGPFCDKKEKFKSKDEIDRRILDDANRRWNDYDASFTTLHTQPPDVPTSAIDFNFSDKLDTITDQDQRKKMKGKERKEKANYGKITCLCKKYCPGKEAIANDENTETTVLPTEDYRQQIPGPLPVTKPWETKAYKSERKGNSNDLTSSLTKTRKEMTHTRDKQVYNNNRNSSEHMESIMLPSSGKDMKYKDLDTGKNEGKSKQYDTGASTEGNENDNLDASDSKREAEQHRMSLISESPVPTHGSKDDRMEYHLPLSEPQATSSPFITDPLIRKETKPTSPPTPEPTMVNKYTMDPHVGARVCACACATAPRRELAVFRSCSGTLRFRTVDTDAVKVRRCGCAAAQPDASSVAEPAAGEGEQGDSRRRSSDQGSHVEDTYTVETERRSQATSPDNTDKEISHLTDLPSEAGPCVPSYTSKRRCSLGEDKQTTTYTDSYSTPTSDFGTLSEGELPQRFRSRKDKQVRHASVEVKPDFIQHPTQTPTSKMEQTLAAISEELVKCRQLLMQTTQSQESPKRASTSVNTEQPVYLSPRPSIALRKSIGKQQIGDTIAPKCHFTIHILTVVFSDEAVMNSRDMHLMLTWQFFDQSVAMTRMRAGRVTHFDFSTEYDVKLTDDFLHYMKYEEMPIKICEINKPDVPFATCTMPFRDALLHANRRADKSLALVAGPGMVSPQCRRIDALDSGDEVGVLDLWCKLRAEPKVLSTINNAIAKPMATRPSISGPILAQLDEDDTEIRMSVDLNPDSAHMNRFHEISEMELPINSANTKPPTNESNRYPKNKNGYRDSTQSYPVYASSTSAGHSVPQGTNAGGLGPEGLHRHAFGADAVSAGRYSRTSLSHSLGMDRGHQSSPLPPRSIVPNSRGMPTTNEMKRAGDRQNTEHALSNSVDNIKNKPKDTDVDDLDNKYATTGKMISAKRTLEAFKRSKMKSKGQAQRPFEAPMAEATSEYLERIRTRSIYITVLWVALNEECEAMNNPHVQRLYVAYSFLSYSGAELETPNSLPKPEHYMDKCYFNFEKKFQFSDYDMPNVGRMGQCRTPTAGKPDPKDCVVFTVISEPVEDPLGLDNCVDLGNAYLYFGDLLAWSRGSDIYTEVLPVHVAGQYGLICGVLAVKVAGLDVVRKCLMIGSREQSFIND
ncbi:uncharacterized protein LOC113230166 isoform X3 [Hyposmocoma kahamanoa]|uniref:uncharacterized protein LOC113230166 isoform X3 n=1 Tax=Hyposmocoma kahamanoa TaxID=1477025 RepID=UPI000E6D7575|nr:uncharacterized protein LOC113230166 isoform X3 [Hyposmocoma kahamanoa]